MMAHCVQTRDNRDHGTRDYMNNGARDNQYMLWSCCVLNGCRNPQACPVPVWSDSNVASRPVHSEFAIEGFKAKISQAGTYTLTVKLNVTSPESLSILPGRPGLCQVRRRVRVSINVIDPGLHSPRIKSSATVTRGECSVCHPSAQ